MNDDEMKNEPTAEPLPACWTVVHQFARCNSRGPCGPRCAAASARHLLTRALNALAGKPEEAR